MGHRKVEFFSCEFLRFEMQKHRARIQSYTGLTEAEVEELQYRVTGGIDFIDEALLPDKEISDAEELLKDIDLNDTPFLALNNRLNALLWTGDKRLANGLRSKGYDRLVTTAELVTLTNELD